MVTIRCFPDDILTLHVSNRGSDGGFFPSVTPPVWTLSSHVLAEFMEQSPDQHTIKVKVFAVGAPVVTATLDSGAQLFTLSCVAPPVLTKLPFGDYDRNPPLRPKP